MLVIDFVYNSNYRICQYFFGLTNLTHFYGYICMDNICWVNICLQQLNYIIYFTLQIYQGNEVVGLYIINCKFAPPLLTRKQQWCYSPNIPPLLPSIPYSQSPLTPIYLFPTPYNMTNKICYYSVFNLDYQTLIMYLSVFVHQANLNSAVYKAQGKINAHNLCLL